MKRLLVTGGTGFIGSACVRAALSRGFDVHVLARDPSQVPTGAHGHPADLLQGQGTAVIHRVRPTHLLHLAWITTPGVYWTSEENERWVEASLTLLDAFADAGGERAVLSGSCAEYDWTEDGLLDEATSPLRPATPYGRAKTDLSRMATDLATDRGLSLAWARLFFVYGPAEHPDRLLPYVIRQLLSGEPALCTQGDQRRDFLHVDDVAEALLAVLGSGLKGPVNIASGDATRVAEIIDLAATTLGAADLVRLGARPTSPDDPPLLAGGTRRIQGQVGWHPRVSLDSGVSQTVAWWRERHDAAR